jgi:hypothetical protein
MEATMHGMLRTCQLCQCHFKEQETRCPHCGAARSGAARDRTLAVVLLGLSALHASCSSTGDVAAYGPCPSCGNGGNGGNGGNAGAMQAGGRGGGGQAGAGIAGAGQAGAGQGGGSEDAGPDSSCGDVSPDAADGATSCDGASAPDGNPE